MMTRDRVAQIAGQAIAGKVKIMIQCIDETSAQLVRGMMFTELRKQYGAASQGAIVKQGRSWRLGNGSLITIGVEPVVGATYDSLCFDTIVTEVLWRSVQAKNQLVEGGKVEVVI